MRSCGSARLLAAIILVIITPAMTQAQQASGAPQEALKLSPADMTLQEQFNFVSSAQEEGRCREAVPIFESLKGNADVPERSIAAGAIDVRYGKCLVHTGNFRKGRELIERGLPILEAAGSEFDQEIVLASIALGMSASNLWQKADAMAYFNKALSYSKGVDRIQPLMYLAREASFDPGPEPVGYLDEAMTILSTQAEEPKKLVGALHTLRGRILMNRGQHKEALKELQEALELFGGLGRHNVTLEEASLRSDLAQAALLNGDRDRAREYLFYTGAGRLKDAPFSAAARMDFPSCGLETGLTPDDVAIVEFAIGDNGEVAAAKTIYSRSDYETAAAFAKAVSQWLWPSEYVATIPPFYRLMTRVELRCTQSAGDLPDVLTPLKARFLEWAGKALSDVEKVDAANALTVPVHLEAIATEQEAAGNLPAAIAALGLSSFVDWRSDTALVENIDHALQLADIAAVDPSQVNALKVLRQRAEMKLLMKGGLRRWQTAQSEWSANARSQAELDTDLVSDPLAINTLLLLTTESQLLAKDEAAFAILSQVAQDGRLDAQHPLRQLANLKLANLAAQQDKFEEAHEYFLRTGLSEEQCALIGATPAMRRTGVSSSDYPQEAIRMGFEGWVRMEFDIDVNGRTQNAYPIAAYPPFVFVEGAAKIAEGVRYESSYRPSGGTACSAENQTISFMFN